MQSSQIVSIKKINTPNIRYNLEVKDNNNYFANNILVHNCRCIAICKNGQVTLMSRANKEFTTLDHIKAELVKLVGNDEVVFDGELFTRDIPINEINSLAKRKQDGTEKLEYNVYDCIMSGGYKVRWDTINKYLRNHDQTYLSSIVIPVATALVHNAEEIHGFFQRCLLMNFEGAMIRLAAGQYKAGYRSHDLLKLKEFQDADFVITDVRENDKMPGTAVFVLVTPDGNEFKAMPEGAHSERRAYWKNRTDYIGKVGIVRFFNYTKTANPVPFHPVFVRVREEQEG